MTTSDIDQVSWKPNLMGQLPGNRQVKWKVKVNTDANDQSNVVLTMNYPIIGGTFSASTVRGVTTPVGMSGSTPEMPMTPPANVEARASTYDVFAEPVSAGGVSDSLNNQAITVVLV